MNNWFDIRYIRPVMSGYYRVFTKSGKHLNAVYVAAEDSWDLDAYESVSCWAFQETGKDILNKVITR